MRLGILLALCTLSCTAQVSDGTSITAKEFALKYGKVTTSNAQLDDSISSVTKVPFNYKFDPFYQKYFNASGIPIVGSAEVSDEAFYKTREIVMMMLRKSHAALKTKYRSFDDGKGRDSHIKYFLNLG